MTATPNREGRNGHVPLGSRYTPLAVASDMMPTWRDTDLDFDTAADRLVQAHKNDGDARDLPILDLRTWGVVPVGDSMALAPLARHHDPMPLRANGYGNLASRLGAPADFIRDRLPAPLQLATLNYLLTTQKDPMPATLRLRGGEIAALVSNRYAPLDAEDLVTTLRIALDQFNLLERVRVRSIAAGMVDVLRLVLPNETQPVRVGDVTAVGLDVSTSSFGRSSVHVRGLLWRLKCLNGLRVADRLGGFSVRHVGDAQRLRDGIEDAIPTVLTHARGAMHKWQSAVDFMIDDVRRQIEELHELTAAERAVVVHEVKRETGVPELPEATSLYSLLNAVTAAAKVSAPARRIEIESVAGRLLDEKVPS